MYNIFWPSGLLTIYGLNLVQLKATSVADPVFFVVNLFSFYYVSSPWELDRIAFLRNRNAKGCENSRCGTKQALSPKVNYLQEVTS